METTPFFEDLPGQNTQWNRVSGYKPQLYAHVDVSFHSFRGEPWYVLSDTARKQAIRVNKKTFNIISQFDGSRSVKDIYTYLSNYKQDEKYSQSDMVETISRLLELKILAPGVNLNTSDFLQQKERERKSSNTEHLFNPLAIKIPLFNPNSLFEWFLEKLPFFLAKPLLWSGLAFIVLTCLFAIGSYVDIKSDLYEAENYLANNALLLIASYIFLKFIHELAHGVCLKSYGKPSVECGLTVMVFMPIPYVDASAAWTLNSKWQRIMISLAGIYTELLLSCIALSIYLLSSNEIIQHACLGLAVVGFASSVFFNANPLLKFDGYFVLEDMVEIPDLFDRSRRYCKFFYKNLIFAKPITQIEADEIKKILLIFGHCTIIFRLILSYVIASYLIETFFAVGVILSCFLVYQQLIKPLISFYEFIIQDVLQGPKSKIAAFRVGLAIAATMIVIFYIPLKNSKTIQGVSWADHNSKVLAPQYSRLRSAHINNGAELSSGELLFRLESEDLKRRISLENSKLKILETNYFASFKERKQRLDFAEEIKAQKEALGALRSLLGKLEVKSHSDGKLVLSDDYLLQGRWFEKGQLIAYVLKDQETLIRAAVNQDYLKLIRDKLKSVTVRLASRPFEEHQGELIKVFPKATLNLPHEALSLQNGGQIISQFDNSKGSYVSNRELIILEIKLPSLKQSVIGDRAFIKLNFEEASLYELLSRKFKQTFSEKLVSI
ncbi:HlyD family efflux transporter periplasmic adaptor subunit [uncultured Pseudoteredinibacter sp.]|uniref:HlyD family efflux transporter periplasmic adaptor subunit n=1 Tax=uncultured Pseudoteredinibacter sp. TaxID=1641701 RepID=UPI002626D3EC|nr:HlyD family efflux transporter periplasmic adaptor subunit [uncultured Pseudoteredinibacter sp.]